MILSSAAVFRPLSRCPGAPPRCFLRSSVSRVLDRVSRVFDRLSRLSDRESHAFDRVSRVFDQASRSLDRMDPVFGSGRVASLTAHVRR